jgi:hypothetical protein
VVGFSAHFARHSHGLEFFGRRFEGKDTSGYKQNQTMLWVHPLRLRKRGCEGEEVVVDVHKFFQKISPVQSGSVRFTPVSVLCGPMRPDQTGHPSPKTGRTQPGGKSGRETFIPAWLKAAATSGSQGRESLPIFTVLYRFSRSYGRSTPAIRMGSGFMYFPRKSGPGLKVLWFLTIG